MKRQFILFAILFGLNSYSQLSKTHYIPPLTVHNSRGVTPQDHYIYISTPSEKSINFKIIEIGNQTIEGTVSKSSPFVHYIGAGENTQLFIPSSQTGIVTNKGFIIESDGLVFTSIRSNAGGGNQAGGLVAKGNSALGKRFRAGAMINSSNITGLLNFISVLATENNTQLTLSNIPVGTFLADGTIFTNARPILLNKNESYVLAINDNLGQNMLGALIEASKNVVVNCGSFGGTNDPTNSTPTSDPGRDVGFDQIVSSDKIGSEYIFIKGQGSDFTERVLVIADEPDTALFINGSTSPIASLQAGEYFIFSGSQFLNENLYLTSSKNVFAYQSIGGAFSSANQNLFFVPPINCSTPKIVDNIPKISRIGNTDYSGVVNIVTEKGATVLINDLPITSTPVAINGTSKFVYYSETGLSGDISIKSTKQVYVSYYGTNSFATYGGYYSGFDSKPEIILENSVSTTGNCIPTIALKTSPDSDYSFQWIYNSQELAGENGNALNPVLPGYYQVKRSITSCNTNALSDIIPISNCPTDKDSDTVPDAIDLDNDNDGITNCNESLGNQELNLTTATGTIAKASYSNSYTTTVKTTGSAATMPITPNVNGSFTTLIPAGKGNAVQYKMEFNKPIALDFEYVSATNNVSDLLIANSEFVLTTENDKTITVLNPTNQLLIDTNYDGIYESGISRYSSFEVRFKLNGITPLAAGTGTFSFQTYASSYLQFTQTNSSETEIAKASFAILASCLPKDTDGDGLSDQEDTDSDGDDISDFMESQADNPSPIVTIDSNQDGIFDGYESGTQPLDTDKDLVPDYLDLDTDNDGILDKVESGTNASTNDFDGDKILNFREKDSDNDLCFDVIEAGFTDQNGDGLLGPLTTPNVNTKGIVTDAIAYTTPGADYAISGLITINTQPKLEAVCELGSVSANVVDNGGNSYQWQYATDGTTWNDLSNDAIYTGVTTSKLSINKVVQSMDGYQYRVVLQKAGNSCGLISNPTSLIINPLPILDTTTDLLQCDDDSDGISFFNLTEKNNTISMQSVTETFSYFTTKAGATANDSSTLIANPIAFESNSKTIGVRVQSAKGCVSTTSLNLVVSSTQIPSTFQLEFSVCDDAIDSVSTLNDGISKFDFSSATSEIQKLLIPPYSNYSIKYYPNEAHALAETQEITDTANYRNTSSPNLQSIWVRVESVIDNACFALGPHIELTVNKLPSLDTNDDGADNTLVCLNLPTQFVTLDSGINDGSPSSLFTFTWTKDGTVLSANTPTLNVNSSGVYSVNVVTTAGCERSRSIKVGESEIATINQINVIDLADVNSVEVLVSGKGIYEYSLDAPSGNFQNANKFENVSPGIHLVYVTDKNGCGTVNKSIAVIGVPKFFTPNGDNFHDFWNIQGVNGVFNSKSIIYIFDRYHKLLKQLVPSSDGWDGTFNGLPLPADDYWFRVQLEDGREIKGHFSLKR